MRAFQPSVGLFPAMFLAVMAVTATDAEAQNPATFTSDIRPIMERSFSGPVSTCVPGMTHSWGA